MRMCVGTQMQRPKRELVRLIRTADGHIVVDPSGKRSGSRGVYLSKSLEAAQMAIKHKRLEAAFGQPVAPEDIEAILAFFRALDEHG